MESANNKKGKLEGKTAIITGASSGIGKSTALLFASEGCNLVITARREELLKEVKKECESKGVKVSYYAGDIRQEQTAKECVALALKDFGKIDILINNAGIGKLIKLVDSTAEDYKEIMDTNVFSSFIFSKYAVEDMLKRKEGMIVFVSSVTGHVGHEDETIYTMTKFAQRGLSQAIDKELGSQGIKTCVMCPSATKTDFEIGFGRTKEGVAQTNWETADDVAEGILYACTAKNKVWEIRMK